MKESTKLENMVNRLVTFLRSGAKSYTEIGVHLKNHPLERRQLAISRLLTNGAIEVSEPIETEGRPRRMVSLTSDGAIFAESVKQKKSMWG